MSEQLRVRVDLEIDEDGYPPAGAEIIWTTPTEDRDVFVVDSIPVFIPNLALGDAIHVYYEDDEAVFDRIASSGGHSTIWIVVDEAFLHDDAWRAQLRQFLMDNGCESEWDKKHGILAVDVPPEADIDAVEVRLRDDEARGDAVYAHGALRH